MGFYNSTQSGPFGKADCYVIGSKLPFNMPNRICNLILTCTASKSIFRSQTLRFFDNILGSVALM
ncbi:uncharacterized protein BYT42DRAFT_554722 [Radiomyces spectabilis]|uniref:uncharacterized protein n=1 Tax=Radiomyces spectabilis TaxID=64574 RepID=UPI00221FA345|nr:uncharacterized protein BYT42DRAFT_554722 [Radiomyces spectabilis]KAI8390901.1 hypothetical protein BYT42DRAFT_554722 [Radiomyces spectabilis]